MKNKLFQTTPVVKPKLNKFDLSHYNVFAAGMGVLYPVLCQEALPGDIFHIKPEILVRTAPLVAPAFAQMDVDIRFFFVPNRIIYKDWEKFIVRGDDGNTDYVKPFFTRENCLMNLNSGTPGFVTKDGSLLDFLGFPTMRGNQSYTEFNLINYPIDALPINAYNKVYNDYYRDENLQPEVFLFDQSGNQSNFDNMLAAADQLPDDQALNDIYPLFLRRSAFYKDYFTSALPEILRGQEISVIANNISIPYATPVYGSSDSSGYVQFNQAAAAGGVNPFTVGNIDGTNSSALQLYLNQTDLQSTAITIDQLRTAVAITQFMELQNRYGTGRYNEYLVANFGVFSKDYRLDRAEYIGGERTVVSITEIPQTSETSDNSPQGSLSGKGLSYSSKRTIKYKVDEHGFILAIFRIVPKVTYFTGLPRMWSRFDSYDYYVPSFDHLSEQAIKRQELFFNHTGLNNDEDFGYTPRFSEYRFAFNEVHGAFRSSLSYWCQSRLFGSGIGNTPILNKEFIQIQPNVQGLNNIFSYIGDSSSGAITDNFFCYISFREFALRPMSLYAQPKF